ncbi:MAG: hypothetical protein ACUVR7_00920 [Armatimonadota bacterium]
MRHTFIAYTLAGVLSFVLCLADAHAQYTITDLGAITPNGQSRGYGINNLGEVAGWSDGHAFFWTAGVMIDLGVLAGSASKGRDVNDLGQVVGWSDTAQARHPFIWQDLNGNRRADPGEMVDLRPIPSTWQGRAYAINNAGHVVDGPQLTPMEFIMPSAGSTTQRAGGIGLTSATSPVIPTKSVSPTTSITSVRWWDALARRVAGALSELGSTALSTR